jgi:hypothetical protein
LFHKRGNAWRHSSEQGDRGLPHAPSERQIGESCTPIDFEMTTFYATTRFFQNDQQFECTWDLNVTKEDPSEKETITHLASILKENMDHEATWGLEEDDSSCLPLAIDLHGLSPEEFARELVMNTQEAEQNLGVTWEISTRWEEVDPDNWEHPCNL